MTKSPEALSPRDTASASTHIPTNAPPASLASEVETGQMSIDNPSTDIALTVDASRDPVAIGVDAGHDDQSLPPDSPGETGTFYVVVKGRKTSIFQSALVEFSLRFSACNNGMQY